MAGKHPLGEQVFISYRSQYYSTVEVMGQWLVDQGYCLRATCIPPDSLCERGEIISAYEYVELMGNTLDILARADGFVFLDTPDYLSSYFTQAEILQWRRFRDRPVFHPCVISRGRAGQPTFLLRSPIALETLDKNAKKLWAGLSTSIAHRYRGKFQTPFVGGKFCKNYFVLPCLRCGEHFVAHKDTIQERVGTKYSIVCPHCGENRFHLWQKNKKGLFKKPFYRNALILESLVPERERRSLRVLDAFEILALMIENELPPSIKLFGAMKTGMFGWR